MTVEGIEITSEDVGKFFWLKVNTLGIAVVILRGVLDDQAEIEDVHGAKSLVDPALLLWGKTICLSGVKNESRHGQNRRQGLRG